MFTSDEEIRSIIPSLQRASSSQVQWVDKLRPYITRAEAKLRDKLSGDIDVSQNPLAMEYVAFTAWADAIHAIDLVATETGFGIVSTQTVAPASRDRVEAARRSALAAASSAGLRLLDQLRSNPDWWGMKAAKKFSNLFPDPRDLFDCMLVYSPDNNADFNPNEDTLLDWYLAKSYALVNAEAEMALCIIGRPALEILRGEARKVDEEKPYNIQADTAMILALVRVIVARVLCRLKVKQHIFDLWRTLDRMTPEDSKIVAEFKDSSIYKAYKEQPYENKKTDGGFFF